MTDLTNKRCGECGKKAFVIENVKNKHSQPWRDFPRAYVTVDLNLAVCQECGNYSIGSREDAQKIDAAIEASIKSQVSQFIQIIKNRTQIKSSELAEIVGVSPSYLSQLSSQKKLPSFQVWNFLKGLAKNPDQIDIYKPSFDFVKDNLLLRA
jgi:DNA-binding transcriptional regulator YiaG